MLNGADSKSVRLDISVNIRSSLFPVNSLVLSPINQTVNPNLFRSNFALGQFWALALENYTENKFNVDFACV